MRKLALVGVALSWLSSPAHAGPCDQGVLLNQGAFSELTSFGADHKPMGKVVATIVSSVANGDTVTAVESIDSYAGQNKSSTATSDLVCDGKTVAIKLRNDDGLKAAFSKAAESSGNKLLSSAVIAEPQIYPLTMKVGDELPAYRAFSMQLVQKPPPDWGSMMAKHDTMALLFWAITNKMAITTLVATWHIKVVGQESCALPGGGNVPCFRITKDTFMKLVSNEAEAKRDLKELAKGATMQPITEWFAPGIGVVKLDIGPAGHPIITMGMTALKR